MEDGNHTFVDAYGFVRPLEEKDVIDALQKKVAERDAARAIKWKKEKLFADVTKHASIDKLKPHCRLGIPSTLRGDVWLVVSGASVAMATNEDKYAQLIDRMSMINFSMSKPIETDVRRTFPNHVDFAGDGSDMDKV
ncbi:hypothetical protein SARC_01939 [Sphaeroforma arctica JP610]|uniref:Rab-GAP TBC domain-containing protein n=1 Tax=Sphaeroforma arctica JP610 TaxID=667725 RepID=A0A0L0GAI6_9EUKA|nr:hypothetical protein SARC_01939 [Sphaeroforma arctica JP610]KNC85901.1 hypothetical protein SARC_01939 [Sphaeroforma arctica JP610]|eukprot:XP_014159803.1 hypothetical protein SARC_01939 [Sphaeroforma arctica JP610]